MATISVGVRLDGAFPLPARQASQVMVTGIPFIAPKSGSSTYTFTWT
jgi:hypothetical protein